VGYVQLKIGSLVTEDYGEPSASDIRADIEAVERAIWAIWHSATASDDEPSR
jgi:hypothetical protein